jgi:signal peptidase II
MLFFPIVEFYWPNWVPLLGGDYFLFFSPVFNVADSAIFLGVLFIIIWQKSFFRPKEEDASETGIRETATNIDSASVTIETSSASPETKA